MLLLRRNRFFIRSLCSTAGAGNYELRLAKHTVPTCPLSSTPLLNYSDGLGYHSQFNIGLDASGRFFNEGVLTVGEGGTCVLCPV